MKIYRLGPIVVSAIGSVSTLLAVTALIYLLIIPAQKRYDLAQKRYLAAVADASPAAFRQANADLAEAKANVGRVKFRWAYVEATKMPRYDVRNRVQALNQLSYELAQYLGPDLEHHLRQYHGKETAAFSVPPPPPTPNAITALPFAIPLGTVTSRGSQQNVLSQFRDWGYFNRVVLLDNLALHGNSPYVQATYDATVYLLPQNDDKLPPPIPAAGGGPAGAGDSGGAAGASGSAPAAPADVPD